MGHESAKQGSGVTVRRNKDNKSTGEQQTAARTHETVQGTGTRIGRRDGTQLGREPTAAAGRSVVRRRKDRYARRAPGPASRPTAHRARLRLQLTQRAHWQTRIDAHTPAGTPSTHTDARGWRTHCRGRWGQREGAERTTRHGRAEESGACNRGGSRVRIVEPGVGRRGAYAMRRRREGSKCRSVRAGWL
ncbi:hypothetical protein EIP86_004587 [Pleurotus ostreatoroseus]|nr:hypothetical protein EIP86_004587 [Pleurotus ostreatoroseus]